MSTPATRNADTAAAADATRPSIYDDPDTTEARTPRDSGALLGLAIGCVVAAVLAVLVGDRTVGAGMGGMPMTHYMGLLSVQQPGNLLLFMALPVVLAETLAITELVLLLNPAAPRWVRALSRGAGLLAAPVWVFILVHLLVRAVLPLTAGGGWRGPADVIAVGAYLLGGLPMLGVALVEAGLLGPTGHERTRLHVAFIAVFLVVSHVAMVFGMLDPSVMGWQDPAATAGQTHQMENGETMPGMDHSTMNH